MLINKKIVPIFGGVMDGGKHAIPDNASQGYQVIIANRGEKSEYILQEDGDTETLVAKGTRWPILDAAPA